MKIPVLFTQVGSLYSSDSRFDVYDVHRDAFTFSDRTPLIAHPPCRLFSKLRGLSTAHPAEKKCAFFSLAQVRQFGGILEHPRSSTLWKTGNFNLSGMVDDYGGFLRSVNLSWFGFPAEKKTMLYFCGLNPGELPPIPLSLIAPGFTIGQPTRSGMLELPQVNRSQTPQLMLDYFANVIQVIRLNQ